MIVLNVTYKCKPDRREEFLEMIYAEGIDEACRAEDGNMKYDYYTPTDGSDDLFLVEKQAFDKAFQQKDNKTFYAQSDLLFELLSDLDDLNSHHPHATLSQWIQQARDMGSTPGLKDYYEMNARRLITTWGGSLNDYACRCWNGLMWDYYAKRWEIYIRKVTAALLGRVDYDKTAHHADIDKYQEKWVTSTGEDVQQTTVGQDVLNHCRALREKYRQQLDTWATIDSPS